MTYHVTARDIVHGVAGDPCECPVARAIRRRHPTQRVLASTFLIRIGDQLFGPPMRVNGWMNRFDSGKAVRPMRFELL